MRKRTRVRVNHQYRNEEEQEELDRTSDSIRDVIFHALEDLAAERDGIDDHAQAGFRQHDICRGTSGVRRSFDGNSDI